VSDTFAEAEQPSSHQQTRAVFAVGPGRRGAHDLARALELLGLDVPSARGADRAASGAAAGDPDWIADFHERLLRRSNVTVSDARPQAWLETGKLATDEEVRHELFDWLEAQTGDAPSELVISDPRLGWFLGLWHAATLRTGVEACYAVVLRSPADVIAGAARQSPAHGSDAVRAAGWINHALHTERATRGSRRAFVPHQDLLVDWTVPLYRLGERFDLDRVHNATAKEIRKVHDLIDSRADGAGATPWSDLDVPAPLRTLIDEAWDQLGKLAAVDDEPTDVLSTLDELRRAYTQLYADAERITQSSLVAARRRQAIRRPSDAADQPPTPPTRRRRLLPRRPLS